MSDNCFIHKLRVHIEDTDYMGVVYHANYLKFMERARSEWMAEQGMTMQWQHTHHISFPVHSVFIEFLKPARLHEQIEVVTKFKAIKPASLIFDQHLRLSEDTHKILCTAAIKLACVDLQTMKPKKLPHAPILETIRRSLT